MNRIKDIYTDFNLSCDFNKNCADCLSYYPINCEWFDNILSYSENDKPPIIEYGYSNKYKRKKA